VARSLAASSRSDSSPSSTPTRCPGRSSEPIGPYTVDALWHHQRLVVELDGRAAHETTRAFEEDRARDRDLTTNGYRVIRITWRQLHRDRAAIAPQLRTLLA